MAFVLEGSEVRADMAIDSASMIRPAAVDVDIVAPDGLKSYRSYYLSRLQDLLLIDVAVVGVPRAPSEGR